MVSRYKFLMMSLFVSVGIYGSESETMSSRQISQNEACRLKEAFAQGDMKLITQATNKYGVESVADARYYNEIVSHDLVYGILDGKFSVEEGRQLWDTYVQHDRSETKEGDDYSTPALINTVAGGNYRRLAWPGHRCVPIGFVGSLDDAKRLSKDDFTNAGGCAFKTFPEERERVLNLMAYFAKQIVKHDRDQLDRKTADGMTPLAAACKARWIPVVMQLLQLGASVNIPNGPRSDVQGGERGKYPLAHLDSDSVLKIIRNYSPPAVRPIHRKSYDQLKHVVSSAEDEIKTLDKGLAYLKGWKNFIDSYQERPELIIESETA